MRKNYFFPMAMAAALALGACSNDDIVGGVETGNAPIADGGYMKVNIKLPQQMTAQRAANDQFDDGLANEYAVKNAKLILFQGNTEATARYHSAYNLPVDPSWGNVDDTPNQITVSTQITKQVDGTLTGENLYALVVLNNNGIVGTTNQGLTIDGQAVPGATFADLASAITTKSFVGNADNGFFMTNAPLSATAGGAQASTGAVTTLANVTGKMYKTQGEAEQNAVDIFVERATAKVTFATPQAGNLGAEALSSVAYTIDGWALDVTNTKSFIVRNFADNSWLGLQSKATTPATAKDFRFVGSAAVKSGAGYRTYWAIDPNYDKAAVDGDFNIAKTVADYTFNTTYGNEHPAYCMENTFDVEHQLQDQTTRVVVRAKLGDGSDFYIHNTDDMTMWTQAQVDNAAKTAVMNNADVQAAVQQWATELSQQQGQQVTIELNPDMVTLSWANRDETTGYRKLAGFEAKYDDTHVFSGNVTANENTTLADVNDAMGNFTYYVGGYAYYPVRIKHFGDDLTPWGWNNETTDNIYPDHSTANYLGRYGVLRNNWYDISVTGIRGIGSAVPPSITGWDDVLKNYIAVRINVLSWAKRSQSVEL